MLEERSLGSPNAAAQYVRSPDGQLVLRDRDADNYSTTGVLGQAGSGLDERMYALSDGMGNIGAITNAAGVLRERYVYTPEGSRGVLSATWGTQPLPTTQSLNWRYGFAGGRLDTGNL